VIEKTIQSLVEQTDRSFSVLISDNHSTEGMDIIARATAKLTDAGICVRCVRPPISLGRVEHWNWAQYTSDADWIKPVFAGDWLDLSYIAKLRKAMVENPHCRYIYVGYVLHRVDEEAQTFISNWAGEYKTPGQMQQVVLRYGMQFGPPSAAAYERASLIALGGYPTPLPICSDSLLFCTMASYYGAYGLPEALCHFNIHGARFSTSLPKKRKDTYRECITYYFMMAYFLWTENVRVPRWQFLKLLLRETRSYLKG
jgi:glycosyltransferase involved in cell wall biosynthesis